MGKVLKIFDLTVSELQRCRELCNFTPDEQEYFEQRSRRKSNVQIALESHWSESKVDRLAHAVKEKIKRI